MLVFKKNDKFIDKFIGVCNEFSDPESISSILSTNNKKKVRRFLLSYVLRITFSLSIYDIILDVSKDLKAT